MHRLRGGSLVAKALTAMACALIFSCSEPESASHRMAAGAASTTGGVANQNMPTQGGQISAAGVRSQDPNRAGQSSTGGTVNRPESMAGIGVASTGGTSLNAGDDGAGGLLLSAGEISTGGHRVGVGHPEQAGQSDVGGEHRTGGHVLAAGQVAPGGQLAPAGQVAGGSRMNLPGGQIMAGEQVSEGGQMAPAGQVAGGGLMNPPDEPNLPGGQVMAGEPNSGGGQMAAAGQMAAGGQVVPGGQVGNGDDLDFSQCENFLTPADDPNVDYLFSACPAYISVASCRAPMLALLARNPAAQLCPLNSGAAAGEEWCPTRGFDNGCWGYVGTGGDANTRCNSGATAFARAFMRNAQTDDERRSCAVVTAVMSHEGGFAPTARSWDMFCNGGDTGAVGLFQYDFASGLDPMPAGVDAQFEQFFRGQGGPTMNGLADFWMACNPRIAGATAAKMADYTDIALPACAAAGAPANQKRPVDMRCRFVGDNEQPDPGGNALTTRCGRDWVDANGRCGTVCADNGDCQNGEICFADLNGAVCDDVEDDNMAGEAIPTTRCGADWAAANGRCGAECQVNEECPIGQNCFADLAVAPCEG